MATKSHPPQAGPGHEDLHFDELSGVYGFFRRYQKTLLYTAGLFTLLTFSITGPLQGFVTDLFGGPTTYSSIVVNGQRVKLVTEDYTYGNLLARNQFYGLPQGVLLPIYSGEGGDSELADSYAIMRRAAIEEDIGVSLVEVDRSLEAERERAKAESIAKLARARGFASLAEYRSLVAEAMRVGTYQRLQLLALDNSDAAVMAKVIADREKVTMKVATFDEKARQKELKAASQLTDDDLRTWLTGKNDGEKMRMSVYDLPIVRLDIAAALYGEGKFDASQWQDGVLKDFTITDDQLKSYYDQMKELLFKVEGKDDEFTPFEDEAVKATLTRVVQVERVMNDLLGKIRQEQTDATKELTVDLERTQADLQATQQLLQDARVEEMTKQQELEAKKAELAAKPDDEQLKVAVAEAQALAKKAENDRFQLDPVVPAQQAAVTAAEKAITDARAAYDFAGAFARLTAGKNGFEHKSMTESKNAEALQNLDELGLELGKWPQSSSATALAKAGDLGAGPSRTSKAIVIYKAIEAEPRPLKKWEDLKPLLEDAYWAEKAAAEGKDKQKAMNDALLRLAKEQMPEFVTEHEGDRQKRIDAKVSEWQQGIEAEIAEAQKTLGDANIGKQARTAWQRKLDDKTRELGNREAMLKKFENGVGAEIDREIADEAKKHYGKVLEAAAAEAGFQVAELEPHPRDLQLQPRFDKRYDPTVVFLFRNHAELKEGDAVGVVKDQAELRYHVAICTKVEPVAVADVSRREFETRRKESNGISFGQRQTFDALPHVFSKEALTARYQFKSEAGVQVEATAQ